jgi:hypothetical protein
MLKKGGMEGLKRGERGGEERMKERGVTESGGDNKRQPGKQLKIFYEVAALRSSTSLFPRSFC